MKEKRVIDKSRIALIIYLVSISFVLGMVTQQLFIGKQWIRLNKPVASSNPQAINLEALQEQVLPKNGFVFKIRWGDLGKRLIEDGIIDKSKLTQALVGEEGSLSQEMEKYLDGSNQAQIELNETNARFWVDVLWGLGLANKNDILEKGPMTANGDASNFASTGGWTIGVKQPMQIYSKYEYIKLNIEQQALVQEIAEGVFRPCCGNSTAFPDCNHGMAALALIELMVSQGFSKDEIYKTVLAFNSYWFPQTYLDIAYHFAKNNRDFKNVSALELLSKTFSSSQGYQAIKRQIGVIDWPVLKSGSSCGA